LTILEPRDFFLDVVDFFKFGLCYDVVLLSNFGFKYEKTARSR